MPSLQSTARHPPAPAAAQGGSPRLWTPISREARLLAGALRSAPVTLLHGGTPAERGNLLQQGVLPLLGRRAKDRSPLARPAQPGAPDRWDWVMGAGRAVSEIPELVLLIDDWHMPVAVDPFAPLLPIKSLQQRMVEAWAAGATGAALPANLRVLLLLDGFDAYLNSRTRRTAAFRAELLERVWASDNPLHVLICTEHANSPPLLALGRELPGFGEQVMDLSLPGDGAHARLVALQGLSLPPAPAPRTTLAGDGWLGPLRQAVDGAPPAEPGRAKTAPAARPEKPDQPAKQSTVERAQARDNLARAPDMPARPAAPAWVPPPDAAAVAGVRATAPAAKPAVIAPAKPAPGPAAPVPTPAAQMPLPPLTPLTPPRPQTPPQTQPLKPPTATTARPADAPQAPPKAVANEAAMPPQVPQARAKAAAPITPEILVSPAPSARVPSGHPAPPRLRRATPVAAAALLVAIGMGWWQWPAPQPGNTSGNTAGRLALALPGALSQPEAAARTAPGAPLPALTPAPDLTPQPNPAPTATAALSNDPGPSSAPGVTAAAGTAPEFVPSGAGQLPATAPPAAVAPLPAPAPPVPAAATPIAGPSPLLAVPPAALNAPAPTAAARVAPQSAAPEPGLALARALAPLPVQDLRNDPGRLQALAAARGTPALALVRYDALQSAAQDPRLEALRVVAPLFSEPVQIWVRADSPLQFWHQVRGRMLDSGPLGGGSALTARTLAAAGAAPAAVSHLDDLAALQALQRGTVQALLRVGPPASGAPAEARGNRPTGNGNGNGNGNGTGLDGPPASWAGEGLRALVLDRTHPGTQQALRQYLPAEGGRTPGVMDFLVSLGADAGRVDRLAGTGMQALCAALPGLRTSGGSGWAAARPDIDLPAGRPYAPAAQRAAADCTAASRPSAAATPIPPTPETRGALK